MLRWLVLLGLVLSSGCTTLRHPAATITPAHPEFESFAMNGRIAIDNNGEHHSAGVHWTHRAQSDEILLLNPLGQTVARVYRDAGSATLDSEGKHYRDTDAESLMQQVLGWQLPLDGLHHWVLAAPDPASPAQVERTENGRLSVLRQDNWAVRYLAYADDKPGSLPSRMQLNHESLKVLLVIDEWNWNPG